MPAPAKIKAFLDQYVVGQEAAKRKISVAVYNHYKRLEANAQTRTKATSRCRRATCCSSGPPAPARRSWLSTLARMLDVPFVIADATTLTEAGYVGEDVENIVLNLYQASNNNLERTLRGIVYIDEIDKLTKKNFTSSVSRDVSGEGVQQALLKILEGTVANIQVRGNKRLPNQETIQIDTTNILFIVGGSFEGLERIIEQRIGRRSVGFSREQPAQRPPPIPRRRSKRRNLLQRVTTEDLDKFGLIPEFIGRLPVVAVMDPLSADDLVHVLTEPKNALIKQYQKLFKLREGQAALHRRGHPGRRREGPGPQERRPRAARHPRDGHARRDVRGPLRRGPLRGRHHRRRRPGRRRARVHDGPQQRLLA